MLTDIEIKKKGLKALIQNLGDVDAEKFISLIIKEPLDYTKWQKKLWPNMTLEEISGSAMSNRTKNKINR